MIQGRSAQRTTTSLSPSWLNEKVTDPPSIWAGTVTPSTVTLVGLDRYSEGTVTVAAGR